ncbi:MAG: hypothetical protein K2H96_00485 [Muribaculaceae bacterium]|nr:hypothetical protein [Muribaculaceae bacterium]
MKTWIAIIMILLFPFGINAQTTDVRIKFYSGQMFNEKISSTDRIGYADSIIKFSSDKELLKEANLIKGELLYDDCRWKEALDQYSSLLNSDLYLSDKENYEVYRKLSLINIKLGNYKDALNKTYTLIRLEKVDSLKYYNVLGKLILPTIYTRTSDLKQANRIIEELEKEIPEVKVDDKTQRFINSYWNLWLSYYYIRQKKWDEAFKALEASAKFDDTPGGNPKIMINKALVFSEIGEGDIAMQLYEQLLGEPLNNENRCIVINNLAQDYFDNGNYKKVLELFDTYDKDISQLEMYHLKSLMLSLKSQAYEGLGDYRQAYQTSQEARQYAEKMSTGYSQDLMDSINQYEREEKNKVEIELRSERRQKFLVATILVLALALFSIGVAYMVRYSKRKRQDVMNLENKIEEINYESEQKLAESHKEIVEVNSEMSEMSMKMAHLSQSIEALTDIVNAPGKDSAQRLIKVRNLLKEMDIQQNIWDVVQVCFERTEYTFFKNLNARHPDLTKGEVRMCVYILKNMSSKEISILTNRSPRTIDAIKYNLRKKLNITEPTYTYLRRLAGNVE